MYMVNSKSIPHNFVGYILLFVALIDKLLG